MMLLLLASYLFKFEKLKGPLTTGMQRLLMRLGSRALKCGWSTSASLRR